MAGRHVGIDIGVHIDDAPFDKLDRRIDRTKANAEQLGRVMDHVKVPGSASEGFDKINRASGEATAKVKGLTDAYKQVGASSNIGRAKGELDNLSSKANKATVSADKLKQSMNRASEQSRAMGDMGGAFDKARTSSDRARNSIDKTAASSGKLKSGWEKLKGAGSALVQVGSSIAMAMVPVAAAFAKANDQAIKLADEYNVIKNLQETGGDSAKAARRSTNAIKAENRRLSLKYGVNQNELAAGSEQLLRRGYSGKQDLAAHKYFLQAARATNEDYNTIVASAAPMLEQFGYKARAGNSVRKMSKYTRDVLNKASYIADLTAGNVGGAGGFGESFKMMGSAAHSNGQSIDTVLGALGTLSNFGEEGSSAGTGMRQIITRLIKAPHSKSMSAALHDLGVDPNSLYTRNGHLKQLGTIFGMLNRASRGKKSNRVSADLQTLFGQTGFNDAQILMNHAGNLQQNVRDSKGAARSNYISRLSAKNMASLKNQMAKTKALANDMGMSFAKEIAPSLSRSLGFANKLLKAFLGMPGPVKKVSATILSVVGALGASKLASGFLKANFGIGNGKGLGAGIGRLIFGKKLANQPRDELGRFTGGQVREGGLINALKGNSFGGVFKLGRQSGLTGKALVGRRLLGGAVGVGTALDVGMQGFQAFKDRHNAAKRSQDIGGAVGTGAGAVVGGIFGGPLGAAIGAQAGKFMGRLGGKAVNSFTRGFQRKKPPKNFWSLENLGWSTKDALGKIGKWGGKVGKNIGSAIGKGKKWVGKNGKELALTAVSPMLGIPALLYKNNPKVKKWADGVGKTISTNWHNGVKGVGKWFHDMPSNLGRAGNGIKKWAGSIGPTIHKGWNRAITASHYFFKSLPKNTANFVKSTKRNMANFGRSVQRGFTGAYKKARGKVVAFGKWYGKTWNNIWKSVNSNRYAKAFKRGQFFQVAFKDMRSRWNGFSKWFRRGWNDFWNRAKKTAQADWNGTKRNWNNFWGAMPKRWNEFKKGFGRAWGSFWKGVGNTFKGVVKGIADIWNNTIGGIVKGWQSMQKNLGAFGKWASNSWKGTKNNVKAFGNDINYALGGSRHKYKYEKFDTHAAGGAITSSHAALVGEAGPELAYKAGSHARLLCANGPAITKVRAGEHILNAHDTRKVMAGGLGHGLVLDGYASGTTKLRQTSRNVTSSYKKITSDATKSLRNLTRSSNSSWSRIAKQTHKQTAKTRHDAVSDYTGMRRSVEKQMGNMHSGVITTANSTSKGFGKAMNRMHGYAKTAMGDTIDQLNRGIRGIDKVLSQFGGNGSVIKPVHFAQGSDANGRLLHNTIAMVNDDSANRQEAVVKRNGDLWIPRGSRRVIPMEAGDGVLNGVQTQQLAHSWGLQHFAKGSGVSHSELRKIASRGLSDPAKSFHDMYTSNIKVSGPNLQKGTVDLGKNASTHYGNPWSNAMWTVINNAIGGANGKGGSREAFLKYAESTFTGVPYLMRAASKTLSDCSGMVMQALRHFGINIGRTTVAMQESSGVQYLGKSLSKTLPGDLVIFGHGTGAAGHVGIIKNPRTGTMFNETPPHARVTRIADDKGMGYGYYRVRGLHNASQSKKHTQANKSLIALAKRELGSSAIKWIKDKLGDDFGSLGSFSIGGDLRDRARALAGGLKKLDPRATRNGIAAVLGNWNFESVGLNPGAVNSGGGASGLGQWLGGRLANLKAYARRHGTSWKNAGTQLSFAVKGEGSDSAILRSILEGHGSVASLANRFSAEWERGGYNAQHVQGAMQIRKALGFAKGGNHYGSGTFLVGENGPELISTDGKTHIDNADQTKKKLSDLFDEAIVKKPKPIKVHRPNNHTTPTINININGPISSTQDAHRVANIVRQEVAKVLENIGDEFGTDPTLY
jgi:phage tail tape measure protein, TP901 family|nr:MAG TPA: minor tail protein [Caudoviricetes sp.]